MRGESYLKAVLPPLATQTWSARRHMERLTGQRSWRGAFRRSARAALLGRFNLSLLPDASLADVRAVVDVGANLGDWSAAVLSLVRPQQLVLFEPDPRLTTDLMERFGSFREVTVVPKAVGRDIANVELHQTSSAWANSILRPMDWTVTDYGRENLTVERSTTVQQVNLDTALREYEAISLLKIDVQGAELQVLEGARETLTRTDTVILEANWRHHYHGDAVFCALHECLAQNGFELTNLSAPTHGPDGRALWSDAVYMSVSLLAERSAP